MRADDLHKIVIAIEQRLDVCTKKLDQLQSDYGSLLQHHNDHRRSTDREIAVLQQQVIEAKARIDVGGSRAFALIMTLVGAAVGAVLTYLFKKP